MPRLHVAQLIFGIGRIFARIARAHTYAAVGLLPDPVLRQRIAVSWDDFYSTDEFIDGGLWSWEKETLDEVLRPGDAVLIIGAGTGRDMVALSRRGHDVIGIEPSLAAAARARQALADRGIRAQVITGFFLDAALPRRYEVIVFSWQAYSYIAGAARRIAALRKAVEHLEPGGRIVISYVNGSRDSPRLLKVAGAVARLARSGWRPEPGDSFGIREHGPFAVQYEHTFTPGELQAEATAAGLRVWRAHPVLPVVALVAAREWSPRQHGL